MKQTIKIEKIDRSKTVTFTDKKTGHPKTLPKIGIFTDGKWISGFQAEYNDGWKEGDIVNIEYVQNGSYWNLLPPPKPNGVLDKLNSIEAKIDALTAILKSGGRAVSVPTAQTTFDDDSFPA